MLGEPMNRLGRMGVGIAIVVAMTAWSGCSLSKHHGGGGANASLVSITITWAGSPQAPALVTGQNLQLSGYGTLSDGSQVPNNGQATWVSSKPAIATIDQTGLVTGVSVGTTTISASESGITGTIQLTVVTPSNLTIANASLPNGIVGASYSSTQLNVSGGTGPYTWSFTGNLPPGLVLASAGTISGTPMVAGTFNFTVQVQDVTTATATAAAVITVVTSNGTACGPQGGQESLLNGQHAFLIQGSDVNGPDAVVGSFTADGAGNITAGEEDLNVNTGGQATTQSIIPANHSYTVGSDHRGCLALTTTIATYVYRFSLGSVNAGVAAKGRLVEFDTSGTVTGGVMKLRDSSAFSTAAISGNYAFGIASPVPGQFAAAGAFTTAAGAISSGAMDANLAGDINYSGTASYPVNSVAFSGSDAVDANGRGTLSFTSAVNQLNSVCYVVTAGELYCISSDSQTVNQLFLGKVLQQSGGTFSNASLSGTSVRYLSGIGSSGSGVKAEIGLVQADGAGNFSQTADTDDGGTFSSLTASGTYSIAANGRVSIGVDQAPVFYLVGPNQGFSIGTSLNVSSGFLEPQSTGPFTNGSLSGKYSFGQFVPSAEPVQYQTGEIVVDGTANVSGTADATLPDGSLFPDQSLSGGSYSISANGRGTISWNGTLEK